jgi:hypothetical protein
VLSSRQFGIIVVADICGEKTTFSINGAKAEFVGAGDQHDRKYSSLEKFMEFGFEVEVEGMGVYCHQHLHLYPTRDLEASFQTTKPRLYAFVIVCMFAFTGIVFLSYDWFVSNRQQNTEAKANKSNDILHELFPESIAQQLFESKQSSTRQIPTESFEQDVVGAKTIAELYPAATVLCTFECVAGEVNLYFFHSFSNCVVCLVKSLILLDSPLGPP